MKCFDPSNHKNCAKLHIQLRLFSLSLMQLNFTTTSFFLSIVFSDSHTHTLIQLEIYYDRILCFVCVWRIFYSTSSCNWRTWTTMAGWTCCCTWTVNSVLVVVVFFASSYKCRTTMECVCVSLSVITWYDNGAPFIPNRKCY